METLSQLASLAKAVEEKIEAIDENMTREQFSALFNDLNQLQALAPACEAVKVARTAWFEKGLWSFEWHFVRPIVGGRQDIESWSMDCLSIHMELPELLMHWDTISHFLKRSYLGDQGFMENYQRVRRLLKALIKAPWPIEDPRNPKELWAERLKDLEQDVLMGRL